MFSSTCLNPETCTEKKIDILKREEDIVGPYGLLFQIKIIYLSPEVE